MFLQIILCYNYHSAIIYGCKILQYYSFCNVQNNSTFMSMSFFLVFFRFDRKTDFFYHHHKVEISLPEVKIMNVQQQLAELKYKITPLSLVITGFTNLSTDHGYSYNLRSVSALQNRMQVQNSCESAYMNVSIKCDTRQLRSYCYPVAVAIYGLVGIKQYPRT